MINLSQYEQSFHILLKIAKYSTQHGYSVRDRKWTYAVFVDREVSCDLGHNRAALVN